MKYICQTCCKLIKVETCRTHFRSSYYDLAIPQVMYEKQPTQNHTISNINNKNKIIEIVAMMFI